MRRYYTNPPPMPNQLPAFMVKRYYDVPSKVRELIRWSKKEYTRAVLEATRHNAIKFVRFLHEEYSAMRVLAEAEGFADLLNLLNDENYNKLTLRERVFIRRAYELYQSLR
jgi:hypothetical protein